MKEMDAIGRMLISMGWADPITPVELPLKSFTPAKIFPGVLWEQEIERLKQKVLDKKKRAQHQFHQQRSIF